MRGKTTRGSKRMHLLSDLMNGKYVTLKTTAEDRKEWQKLFRVGSHTCFAADYMKKNIVKSQCAINSKPDKLTTCRPDII